MARLPLMLTISSSVALVLLLASAYRDIKDRILPNELVAAIVIVGLAQILIVRPESIWLSLLAALVVFCGLGVLSHYRIIGGGDLKLITAVTFLVPPGQVAQLLLEIALAGGLLSVVYLAVRYRLKSQSGSRSSALDETSPKWGGSLLIKTERTRIAAGGPLPYGLAVLGGYCLFIAREFPANALS